MRIFFALATVVVVTASSSEADTDEAPDVDGLADERTYIEETEFIEDEELPWPDGFEPFLGYDDNHEPTPFTFDKKWNVEEYLNPGYREPAKKAEISELLRDGKLVILRDAFVEDLAQRVHEELWDTHYELNVGNFHDGFAYSHHNAYYPERLTEFLQDVVFLFRTEETQQWIHELTGRDTLGYPANGSPSWYKPGDFSGPHSDNHHQRTVAYVWHLTKNWLPEWGGGLYWCKDSQWENAFTSASFNTLFLFSVNPDTVHFVTHVNPNSEGRRLAFNGWWEAGWYPEVTDDMIPEYLLAKERRSNLTEYQRETLLDMMQEWPEDDPDAERYELLQPYLELLDKDIAARDNRDMPYGKELWPGEPPEQHDEYGRRDDGEL